MSPDHIDAQSQSSIVSAIPIIKENLVTQEIGSVIQLPKMNTPTTGENESSNKAVKNPDSYKKNAPVLKVTTIHSILK